MFKVNEYFEGKVKSLAFADSQGSATIGVIAAGEYEFGTATKEIMNIVSGTLNVLLPGADQWKHYGPGAAFEVAANRKFKVRATEPTSYLCLYR